jgi:hypothetical protein
MRYPKVIVTKEGKSLAQHKDDDKEPPFPLASSVNQGKT